MYDAYDMIIPVKTVFPVSHRSDGEISGESFISKKDAHSLLINGVKSGSCNSDVLKRHLVGDLMLRLSFIDKETGARSLIMMGCILFSWICWVNDLLTRK